MNKEELRNILSEHLATFRTWNYDKLAKQVKHDRESSDCLGHIEGVASDGTPYQIEFQAAWNDKSCGEIIVIGDLSAEPQRPLLGVIPVYSPDVMDSFIMNADEQIAPEHGKCAG